MKEKMVQKTDDLKLINGIGPTIESRLNSIGINTFAQLAAMSPADLAAALTGMVGLTAERIAKQNWIGKAQELDARSTLSKTKWIEEAQSQTRDKHHLSESTYMVQSVVDHSPIYKTKTVLPWNFKISNLEILQGHTKSRHGVLLHRQPFGAVLVLDFTGIEVIQEDAMHYTAILNGKRLDNRVRQILGERKGPISLEDGATIIVDCIAPGVGTYQLEAVVTIEKQNSDSTDLHAHIKGGVFLVH